MKRIAEFATWARGCIVAFAKALNHALAAEPPLENDGFSCSYDDTVFQPRDIHAAPKASGHKNR